MKFILDTNVYIEASKSATGWKAFEKVILPLLPFTYLVVREKPDFLKR